MKAITLTQPWATLVAIGAKRIETRSWRTNYRGSLAIHAAKGLGPVGGKKGLMDLCSTEPFYVVLMAHGNEYARNYKDLADMVARPLLPLGAVVATCRLVNVVRTEKVSPGPQERAFGDYSPGRYAWMLEDIRFLRYPVFVKGALGLWDWTNLSGGFK